MSKKTMAQAINEAFFQKMEQDSSVVILGEDVGIDGGVFRVTEGLIHKFGEERVMDTPLAESSIIGAALGMALNGLKPVAEIQFFGFIYQGFDQILCNAARYRRRSQGRYGIPMVVRCPMGAGVKALEHHSESTEAHFAHVPGIKVVMPATAVDAKGLMISAIEDPDPVIFLEPKRLYRIKKEEVPDDIYRTPIGKARICREGKDVTIVAAGGMVPYAEEAAAAMDKDGVSCEVLDLRTIWPFDMDAISASVAKTGRLVIAHEAPRSFGIGAEIATRVMERNFLNLLAPIKRVTGYDIVPSLAKLEEYSYPNAQKILLGVREVMEF